MEGDDEEVRITLRLPADVRDRVADAAKAAGRSLNGEIVQRLHASFEFDRQTRSIQEERSLMLEAIERQEEMYQRLHDLLSGVSKRNDEA